MKLDTLLLIAIITIISRSFSVHCKITKTAKDIASNVKDAPDNEKTASTPKRGGGSTENKIKKENSVDKKSSKENGGKPSAFSLDKYFSSLKSSDYIFGRCDFGPGNSLSSGEPNVRGSVSLRQKIQGGLTELVFNVSGLVTKQTKYGVHVHNFGDLSEGCSSTGEHYNPFGTLHGGPKDHPALRHFGDLGNLESDGQGQVVMKLDDPLISLLGPFSALGRAIVIHSKEDDLGTKNTEDSLLYGSSGKPLACCVIGLSDTQQWEEPAAIEAPPVEEPQQTLEPTPAPRAQGTTKPQPTKVMAKVKAKGEGKRKRKKMNGMKRRLRKKKGNKKKTVSKEKSKSE